MSDDLGPACAELAALIPALIPALSSDGTPLGRPHRPVSRQRRQPRRPACHDHPRRRDPRRLRRRVEVTGEPWQHHPSAICLRAIPRLHHRLTALGMPAAATDLETGMHHWTRLVKLALGLRTPDIPAGPD
jgi:hypothetical protein